MYSLILHGKRYVELQKWRNLRDSVKLLQNVFAFSNSFSSDVSPRQDESISKKVSSEGKGDPDSVPKLLRSHGFTDPQIADIITDYPLLLIADAEKSIGPKLQFCNPEELHPLSSPRFIYYDFVKGVIEADKSSKFEKLSHSLPQGSKQENKLRKILALR
ncbi:hypothetical protein EUTSA_v10023915mg [Eutrema salsugineum]|uniref:Uncharacterized protein n=1 Tax=Eutrema salsugineum TaxID=72664 RepID=V4KDL8_EUTSA|nr:hypothetical protein EUTSA_v10023915mg [Eutrema salsugineum]